MVNNRADDWSPADNPYAIAVSEAQWWRDAARLAVVRMRRDDEIHLGWFSAPQIDARNLVFALRQLLSAERLEQEALQELGIDPAVCSALSQARRKFEDTLPGIKDMRDGLMHFEDWSRGKGYGPQKRARDAGADLRNVARDYWGFGYDPIAGTVTFGPYSIDVDAAERAASELCQSIYLAAREVDKRRATELLSRTIDVLTSAGIAHKSPNAVINVSQGRDLKTWVSLDMHVGHDRLEYEDLASKITAALSSAGFDLISPMESQTQNTAERLARGELLHVEEGP